MNSTGRAPAKTGNSIHPRIRIASAGMTGELLHDMTEEVKGIMKILPTVSQHLKYQPVAEGKSWPILVSPNPEVGRRN
jgi:hypothetical protein